jgi:hypothetical protein
LGIFTLAAASGLAFKIPLYVPLKLTVFPGLCAVADIQGLDESVLRRTSLTYMHLLGTHISSMHPSGACLIGMHLLSVRLIGTHLLKG